MKIYLKKMLAAFCLLLTVNCTLAQTGNPLWSLPPSYSQVPNPTTALPSGTAANQYGHVKNPYYYGSVSYTNIYATEHGDTVGPHNMMADASGNPLFSVVNGYM
ncbi:MAG: hypothetical protein ABI448_09480 [Bacteroidia bacterium]